MAANSRRLRPLLAVAVVFALVLLARGPSGAPQASAACADTVLVRTVKRYSLTSGSQVTHIDTCTATAVPGRRFLLEVLRPSASNPLDSARVSYGGVEYFGTHDVDASNVLLSRIITPKGADTLRVTLYGGAGAKLDLRVTHVPESRHQVASQSGFNSSNSTDKWYTRYFSFAEGVPAAPHVMTLTNGYADLTGAARTYSPEVWLNSQQIVFADEVTRGRAFLTRDVTLEETNTLEIKIQKNTAGSPTKTMSVRFHATDVTPPVLTVLAPSDSLVTRAAKVLASVQLADSQTGTRLWADGTEKPLTNGAWSDSLALPAQDGKTTFAFVGVNGACLTDTVRRTVIRDTQAPTLEVTYPVNELASVDTSQSMLVVQGFWIDSTATQVEVDGVQVATGDSGHFRAEVPLDIGPNRILTRATDVLGQVRTVWRFVNRVPTNESALSEVVSAPDLPSTEASTFLEATRFLYTGASPLQTSANAGAFDTARVAVLRGKVFARDIGPLPNVTVKVLGHSEYGQTLTRADGRFDLAVNGGSTLTLRFLKAGYLESQRTLLIATNEYVVLDSLAMIGRSSRRYDISLAADRDTVFDTRFESDENGDRRLALMFRSGTGAQVVRAPGDTVALGSTVTVRAKEYTVGNGGPESMPAVLPPSTAYTYCVSLSLDEAEAYASDSVSSPETRFSSPVSCYVRNFLHLPVGATIPSGYYDRTKARWEAGEDGVVLRIVDVVNGIALVDADTVAGADGTAALLALGIDDAERTRLARQYAPGDTLWRVRVDRFSTWDFNLNAAWLAYSTSPSAARARRVLGLVPCPTKKRGSIIECDNRVLGERIPLAGSPFSLNYRSYRMPGDAAMRKLRIPLYGDSLPSQVRKVHVVVDVAGQRLTQVLTPPLASNHATVVWNGLDDYGRVVLGAVTARVGVGYEYGAAYAITIGGGGSSLDDASTSGGGSVAATGSRDDSRISWSRQSVSVGAPGTGSAALGGWTLSAHHFYDPAGSGAIYYGDGDLRSGDSMYPMIEVVAGNGQSYNNTINPSDPAITQMVSPVDLATGPDGLLYILVSGGNSSGGRVYRLTADGKLQLVAGNGGKDFNGDDQPAVEATLNKPNGIAFGPDGSLYILDTDDFNSYGQQRVRRVDPAGFIHTVAGDGVVGPPGGGYGDGGPALAARLYNPVGLAVGPSGAIYIGEASGSCRVRRVGTNGIIRTYAGTGQTSTQDLVGRATTVGLRNVSALVTDRDGVLYIADGTRVKKVTPDGQLTNVTATSSNFAPYSMAVAPDGGLLIVSAGESRLYRRDADGTITPLAGVGAAQTRTWSEIVPAAGAFLQVSPPGRGVTVGWDGAIWVGEHNVVSRIATVLPTRTLGEFMVPSEDGRESYVFSARGRHLKTVDAMTGSDLLTFTYDAQGRLWKIEDADHNETVISREGTTSAVIRGPFGVCDTLYFEDQLLRRVANPNGESVRLDYDSPASGLLTDLYDAKDQRHWFHYDGEGRLDEDHDPESGVQRLTATEVGATRAVTLETALGRTTTYEVRQSFDGYFRKSVEDPAGFKSYYVDTVDDRGQWVAAISSAGDSLRVRPRPEPRFGMFAPIDTGLTVVLPNGLKHRIGLARPYSRTTFDPPGTTGGTWQENVSVNSNGSWQTTFSLSGGTGTWQTTSPENRTVTTTVDASGRPLTVTVPGLSTITMEYDGAGRLRDVTQGTRLWHYDPDDSGRVSRAISPGPDTVTFRYDAAGRLLRQGLPGGRVVGLAYDANGNPTSLTPPGREPHEFDYSGVDQTTHYRAPDTGTGDRETQYGYNLDHQLETITQPGNLTVELDYDAGGRLWHVTQPRGTSTFGYSGTTGQLTSVTSPDAVTLGFGYNGSLPVSETWAGAVAGSVALDWNPDLQPRLQTVSAGARTDTAGFAYDRDGLLRRAGVLGVYPRANNGLPDSTQAGLVVSRQDHDGFGDLANLRYRAGGTVVLQQSVQRDALGRITNLVETAVDSTRTWQYGYDVAGRLATVRRNGLLVQSLWYDGNGNRDSVQAAGGVADTVTADTDAQDRLTRHGGTRYTYTANGELAMKLSGADTTRYTYDALGNLVTVVLPTGTRLDYVIDGRNRRVGRKVDGVMDRRWLYQNGVSPVAELDGDGALLWRFVYGTHAHVPDLAMRGDTAYRVVSDHLGSVRALVRAGDGAVRAWWNYDAWGNVLASGGAGPSLGFAGGLADSLTGLVRFGARDYDPAIGRWTAKDPLRFLGDETNPYAYVFNVPTSWVDPSGLLTDDDHRPRRPPPGFFSPNGTPSQWPWDLRERAREVAGSRPLGLHYRNAWEHALAGEYLRRTWGHKVARCLNAAKELQDYYIDFGTAGEGARDWYNTEQGIAGRHRRPDGAPDSSGLIPDRPNQGVRRP